ncbi:hypothetical protein GGR56DRAFT_397541 [Xylariaceae sp. FL0804]|nr:hypothetical protein GGR56DRAFT_397541 [Xylariaceae sp. FL0804]
MSRTSTPYLAVDRLSIASLDDDSFYSAPSSRIASRHVSVMSPPGNISGYTNSTARRSASLVTECHPMKSAKCPTATPGASVSTPPHSQRATSYDGRFWHLPRPLQLCAASVASQLRKGKARMPSDGQETPLGHDDLSVDVLTSSPALAVTTQHSSLAHIADPRHAAPSIFRLPSITSYDGSLPTEGIEGIICNIRAYLSDKRHDCCARGSRTTSNSHENRSSSSALRELEDLMWKDGHRKARTGSYLVTTNDIAGILDIILAGLRPMDNARASDGCLSLLLPKEPFDIPAPRPTAIVPGTAAMAEPATTISFVQPSFSVKGSSDNHVDIDPAFKSTFISRQSITEVD